MEVINENEIQREDSAVVTVEQEPSGSGEAPGALAAPPKPKKKKRKTRWIVVLVIVAVIAGFVLYYVNNFRQAMTGLDPQYTYAMAERRSVTSALEGSGTLEPMDSYTVTTLVSGDILSADFEEGDIVSKDDVLYQIDSSDASSSIERAEISLAQIERSYNKKVSSVADLTVTAPISGTVTGITAQLGNTVGTQVAVATIEDTSVLTLTVYFSDEYQGQIYSGMSAKVSVAGQMLELNGTVREVSSIKRTSATGVSCFGVTVEVQNAGSLTTKMSATCWITASGRDIYPSIEDDDGFDANDSATVYAGVSGTVTEIKVHNNEVVTAGQTILLLSSDTLDDEILNSADSLRDAQLSLQNQYDKLDNYTITAPIDGTIVDKYYKEGETTESGRTLCTIYDLSSLTFTMYVDELDINQIEVGQKATITADAVPGVVYEGIITKVGINGSTSGGVTTYPVTVRIDETDGLLPGMNVDVTTIVEESENTLAIPAGAVSRGDRVLVKTSDGSTGEGAPEGYMYVKVTTGVSDGDFIEILTGLSEGDEIAYIPDTATSTDFFGMGMGGMGGGSVMVVEGSSGGGGMMP